MAPEGEISWSVRRAHHERSNDWYWSLGAIALAGTLASILFGNILLAIIIIISTITIGVLASREPREHVVKLDPRGMTVDGTRYPFSALHSFWVEHETDTPRLFVSMNGILATHFSFELDDEAHGNRVRGFLKQHVDEVEQGPHVGEHLAELLRL